MSTRPFAGAAHSYAAYRPEYPDPLLDAVLARAGKARKRLVDLGCGTGEVTLPLSRAFEDVVAADVDPDMVAEARRKALERGAQHIRWFVHRAEDLGLPGSCDLITIAGAFHWMDRATLSPRLMRALSPDGVVAVLGADAAPWEATEPWHEAATSVVRAHSRGRTFASRSTDDMQNQHARALERVGLVVETIEHREQRRWTPAQYVGFLRSTSFARVAALDGPSEHFDTELEARLTAFADEHGMLTERRRCYAMIAARPG